MCRTIIFLLKNLLPANLVTTGPGSVIIKKLWGNMSRGEKKMSRLEIKAPNRARIVMEGLYKDLERRIESSPPGLCPVDMSRAFLELCHAQTCGKCVPCRIGLGQLNHFIKDVLDGKYLDVLH